ncbi:MAG: GTA-gp10 family protein [Pseudomonadota bacterium]
MTGGDPEILINGAPQKLRLTLGALAAIEEAVGGGDFEALKTRLQNPRVSDLILILHALIGGGGGTLGVEALKAADIDFAAASEAVAKAFKALEGDAAAPGKSEAGPTEEGQAAVSPGVNGLSTP